MYSNGSATSTASLPLNGTLVAGGVLVVANPSATADFKPANTATSTTISSGVINFNGDDALTLEKSGVLIDRFGQVGVRPAGAWTGGTGNTVSTLDQTLRRKPGITAGDRNPTLAFDPSAQWDTFPVNTSAGLGSHAVN